MKLISSTTVSSAIMIRHLFVLAIVLVVGSQGSRLVGEHVCVQDQKYTVTMEKHLKKNMTIREFVWCVSVPPRCSKYKTVEVDDIKIVEEERTRKVNKCCEGYTESNNQTSCVPKCESCVYGVCTAPETCSCSTGFTGIACNETCPTGFWGPDCALHCRCVPCKPDTGYCLCEPGTTGLKCNSTDTKNCTKENCNNIKLENSSQSNKILPAKEIILTEVNILPLIEATTLRPPAETTKQINPETRKIITSTVPTIFSTSNGLMETSKKNFSSTGKTHRYSDENSEKWQMDEITIENNNISNEKTTLFVFIISIAVGLVIILILVAIMSVMIARYKKQRDIALKNVLSSCSSTDGNKNRLSSQPIIQRSTFHAPLPDPPIFQNPVFTLREIHYSDKFHYYNCTESTNIGSQYDYPPSSGSYRAASLPEPDSEPIYDEIPASRRPRPISSVNSCQHSCCIDSDSVWTKT